MKPKPPDTRLRGAVAVAVCSGLSSYLTTGAGLNSLALALLVGGLLGLLIVIFPPGRKWSRAEDFYVMAVMILVFPWLMLKIGYAGKNSRNNLAWHDLQGRYAATGSAPVGLEAGRDVVVSRVRGFFRQSYPYRDVAASFNDSGAYFAHTFPLSMLYSPVQVPLSGIWRCRADEPGFATVSVRDIEMEIQLPDDGSRILGWCARHGIPDGSEPAS